MFLNKNYERECWYTARIQYYYIWVMCMPVQKKRVVINNYKKWHDEIRQILDSSNAKRAECPKRNVKQTKNGVEQK